MTAVGTPLFCAPEIFRGDTYSEAVDVYSFGLILLAISIDEPLIDFLKRCWAAFKGKLKGPRNYRVVMTALALEGWRPALATALDSASVAGNVGSGFAPQVPPSVAALICKCWQHDPASRPSFAEIIVEFRGGIKEEIHAGIFSRRAPLPSKLLSVPVSSSAVNGATSVFSEYPESMVPADKAESKAARNPMMRSSFSTSDNPVKTTEDIIV
jgi:serine/threonine protein kinase